MIRYSMHAFLILAVIVLLQACAHTGPSPVTQDGQAVDGQADDEAAFPDGDETITVYDPLEPFNRAMFYFNDKLYFYALKPAAQGYSYVVPEPARVGVRRFFSNITTPVRFVNALLQFKVHAAGTELARFLINSWVGVAGLMDPARDRWQIYKQDEDLGQTLGVFGAGPGIYITWPFLGPSNIRDTVGFAGDLFLDPVNYLDLTYLEITGIHAYDRVNETSLDIGIYEEIKRTSLDPYTFVRNAYEQHRRSKIGE
ncbi:MAG: VacJ family lipoprotein [Thermodesulfobacteriota bacterium]